MATSGTKIVVEIGGNINVTSENVKKNVNISEEKEKKQKKQQEKTDMLIAKDIYNVAKKGIIQSVNTVVNNNLSLTENYIGQRTLSNVKNVVGKTESLVSGIMAGAAVGGGVGAAIAVVSWGITQYFDMLEKQRSYYQALNATTTQTEFSQTRAGLYNDGRGTLN